MIKLFKLIVSNGFWLQVLISIIASYSYYKYTGFDSSTLIFIVSGIAYLIGYVEGHQYGRYGK